MKKLIAIVGTNASGKSGLGVRLASRFGGEIISADSRQVFKGLDLGSGKIAPEEMMGVPHHLLDVCAPNDFYSMADFQKQAYEAIDAIHARGKTPFIVGGTGLYVASVTEGYLLSDKMPNLEYRDELEGSSVTASDYFMPHLYYVDELESLYYYNHGGRKVLTDYYIVHSDYLKNTPMDFVEENYELVDEIRFLRIYKLSEDAGK